MFFIQYLIPLLDGFTSWVLTYIEVRKALLGDNLNKIAQEAAERETPKRAIGFVTSEDYEEIEDEEDDL